MSYPANNMFGEDPQDDLVRLRRESGDLSMRIRELQATAPERTIGTDRTGVIHVTLGPDGIPASIAVGPQWQDKIRVRDLADAVTEAAQQATCHRAEVWARAHSQMGASAGAPAPSENDEPDFSGKAITSSPRPVDEIAAEAIGLLDEALSLPAGDGRVLRQFRGAGSGGAVAVILKRDGDLSCEVDAHWAASQASSQVGQALQSALAAARAEFYARQQASGGTVTTRGPSIIAELDARMHEI